MDTPDQRESYFQTWTDDFFTDDQAVYRMLLDVTQGYVRGDVLDIGCGSRVYYDTSAVRRWTGVDLSAHLLGNIKFLGDINPSGPIETLQKDCRSTGLPDESYDFVCAILVLHHLARDNNRTSREIITQAMKEAHRVLRPGGTMVILESWPHILLHIYARVFSLLYPIMRRFFKVELPLFFTARQFSDMAKDAGFGVRHILSSPIYDVVRYPVSGFVSPAWFQRFTHKYGLYHYKKL
jgi:SAM-dependent methyltransferase